MIFQFVFSIEASPTDFAGECFLYRVLGFCVELKFVLPVETFLTDVATECFLSRVYDKVPGEMVSLFERPATLNALVLPLSYGFLKLFRAGIFVF